jgi:hypothetical protein
MGVMCWAPTSLVSTRFYIDRTDEAFTVVVSSCGNSKQPSNPHWEAARWRPRVQYKQRRK